MLQKYSIECILSKLNCYSVVFMLVPGTTIFQLNIVYPYLVVKYEAGVAKQLMHICLISFCFINVVGNLMLSIFKDSTLRRPVVGEGTYCEYCRMWRPAKSWHCKKCNVCIMKRDHHCFFLARCIGLYNQRYFILFLGHGMLSMLYITYYNYYFVTLNSIAPKPLPGQNFFIFYFFLNFTLSFFSLIFFSIQLRNAVTGVTCYESKFPELRKPANWRQNLLNIFGTRWYLAIVWPLCESAIPNEIKGT